MRNMEAFLTFASTIEPKNVKDALKDVDANYVRYQINRKSTSKMAHFFGSCLVS